MIGCGGMARGHIRSMLAQQDSTTISVVCEPSEANYAQVVALFTEAGLTPPPNQPNLDLLLRDYGSELDAAFIITPHSYHFAQTQACMEAGLDVLLEKPMVITGAEAEGLIATRDRTGKLLVVAFPGSLSPYLRSAVATLRSGAVGSVLSISATIWQNWGPNTAGT